jgi:predicted CoA-binding protein
MEDTFGPNLVEDPTEIARIAREARSVAVLGIKPESHRGRAAFDVPAFLARSGREVIPVPVYYPEVTEILGRPVFRRVAEIGRPVDVVVVFRRSEDLPGHLDDLLAARPKVVWLQSGIRNDQVARRLAEAGIRVVQDRCIMVEAMG